MKPMIICLPCERAQRVCGGTRNPPADASGDFRPGFQRWRPQPVCLLVVFALRFGRPPGPVVAVSLTAVRGNEAGSSAPAGRELMLHPDLTGLADASSYRLEIVDQTGRPVRQGTMARAQNGIRVPGLGAGLYFVRVYLPAGELLREYGLQISETRP